MSNPFDDISKDALKSFKDLMQHKSFIESLNEATGVHRPIAERFASLPRMNMPLPKLKSFEEINEYASSGVLISRLHQRYEFWKQNLPDNVQPVIYAMIEGNPLVRVESLSQEGYNGIAIEGYFLEKRCLIVTHQASLQLFCIAEPVEDESQRRQIGFHIDTISSDSEASPGAADAPNTNQGK